MTSALSAYRDDGPLAAALSKIGRQPLPVTATVAALIGLTWQLVADGAAIGWGSLGGVGAFVVLAAVGQARAAPTRCAWLVPPLLRCAEYGAVVFLAWRAGGTAPAASFVLLAAVAFHQYDVDHRVRTRGAPPPRMVGYVGLGWDGRLLLLTAVSPLGLFSVAAAGLGGLYFLVAVVENATVWRHGPAQGPSDPQTRLGPAVK